MKNTRWYFHPVFIFVLSILALSASLTLYIYWYVEVRARLESLIRNYQLDSSQFFEVQTWIVILVLSVLVALILLGILIIFIYSVRTVRLYRLQHNFINNFTHELKTPVTSLRLYLETFAKHELPRDQQIKYLQYMLSDVERLNGQISRILNLARIEGKIYEGDFVATDLVEVVEGVCRENRHIFSGCDIRLHNPSRQTFPCRVDLPLLEMLLMNLITNAIKYNTSERPEMDITFAAAQGCAILKFQDDGIGIAKSETKRIFRKFYQVDRPEIAPTPGTGLGLYLAEHIVRIHKGKIRAESEGPGHGTRFIVTLPLEGEQEPGTA